jgi:hypothetical protein
MKMKTLFEMIFKAIGKDNSIKVKIGKSKAGNKVIRVIGITAYDLDTLPASWRKVVQKSTDLGLSTNFNASNRDNPNTLLTLFEDAQVVADSSSALSDWED